MVIRVRKAVLPCSFSTQFWGLSFRFSSLSSLFFISEVRKEFKGDSGESKERKKCSTISSVETLPALNTKMPCFSKDKPNFTCNLSSVEWLLNAYTCDMKIARRNREGISFAGFSNMDYLYHPCSNFPSLFPEDQQESSVNSPINHLNGWLILLMLWLYTK